MNQRTALILAVGVTAFVLVAVGGIAGRLLGSTTAPAAAAPPTSDVLAEVQQREAAYRQLIDEANARLKQAYQQLAAPEQTVQPQDKSYPITADMAFKIASTLTPGAGPDKSPEMVNFQGAVAYEVSLTSGKVYVDATTGRVLYNGTTPTFTTAQAAGSSGWEDDDDEHEGWDD